MQWFALQPSEVTHVLGLRALTMIQRELIISMVISLSHDIAPTCSIAANNVTPIHKPPPDIPSKPDSKTSTP